MEQHCPHVKALILVFFVQKALDSELTKIALDRYLRLLVYKVSNSIRSGLNCSAKSTAELRSLW